MKTSNDDFVFVIRGDMAFVAYSSNSQNAAGKIIKSREHRILLNDSGQWKILAVQAYADYAPGK